MRGKVREMDSIVVNTKQIQRSNVTQTAWYIHVPCNYNYICMCTLMLLHSVYVPRSRDTRLRCLQSQHGSLCNCPSHSSDNTSALQVVTVG